MKESFIGLFKNKSLGFPFAALISWFAGSLFTEFPLLFRIYKGYGLSENELKFTIIAAFIFTLIFFLAIYIAKSDWMFIVFFIAGNILNSLVDRYILVKFKLFSETALKNLLEPIILALISGLIYALILVMLIRFIGISIWPFLLSKVVAEVVLIMCYILFFWGIKNYKAEYNEFYIILILSAIIAGIIFYFGYLFDYKRIRNKRRHFEISI